MNTNKIDAMCHETAHKAIEWWESRNSSPLDFVAKLDLALCMTDEFGQMVRNLGPCLGDDESIDLEEVRDLLEHALVILR